MTTHHEDGSLASETRFQQGREDGLAQPFHPESPGAGLRTEVLVRALATGTHGFSRDTVRALIEFPLRRRERIASVGSWISNAWGWSLGNARVASRAT